jgi:D-amino-acid dehydrogenase
MSLTLVPIIVRPRERLVINVGHDMLGWTLAMGAGERAAASMLAELSASAARKVDDAA